MKVKIFKNEEENKLEEVINQWIEENHSTIEVVDIKFTAFSLEIEGEVGKYPAPVFTVMIYYKEQEMPDKEVAPDDIPF